MIQTLVLFIRDCLKINDTFYFLVTFDDIPLDIQKSVMNHFNGPLYTVIFFKVKYFSYLAQPLNKVEFPSVTFCSSGNSEVVTNAKLLTQYKDFLTNVLNMTTSDMSPLEMATQFSLVNRHANLRNKG